MKCPYGTGCPADVADACPHYGCLRKAPNLDRYMKHQEMQAQAWDGIRLLLIVGGVLVLIALTVFSTGCASTGIYNMSDDWCAAHTQAPQSRCPS